MAFRNTKEDASYTDYTPDPESGHRTAVLARVPVELTLLMSKYDGFHFSGCQVITLSTWASTHAAKCQHLSQGYFLY